MRLANVVTVLLLCAASGVAPAPADAQEARSPGAGASRPVDGAIVPVAQLVPTADPLRSTTLAAYVLTLPPSLLAHASFPVGGPFSAFVYAGYLWFPEVIGAAASGALKAVIFEPRLDRWGAAVQAQWIGGAAIWRGEGSGGTVGALELVASSPVRRTRVHLGAALHTMPGNEYEAGWTEAKRYDIENPQIALSLAAEHAFGRWSVGAEAIWGGIGADEGTDSVLGALAGVRYARGRFALRAGAGIAVDDFGTSRPAAVLAPPLVSLAWAL